MVQLENDHRLYTKTLPPDGFRLQRLEIYNWGTFDQKIWKVELHGGTSLLTGANGSGKSTLIDALLTLLVPYRRRTYNLASGAEKVRERDERSYILGAWGKQKDLENNRSKAQYLRPKGTYSVLLAVFSNARLSQNVTIAQVLWVDQTVHKLYCLANTELSIHTHFRLQGAPVTWKKYLRNQDISVFDEFIQYSRRFRQLLSLESEKSLDLFNQIVSIKEIGGLNTFVREHMLEKTDAQVRIRQLRDNFENLTRAHDAIQLAERQLAILEPLMKNAQKYKEQLERIEESNQSSTHLPIYIASIKEELLTIAIKQITQQLHRIEDDHNSLTHNLNELNQHIIDLNLQLRNDTIGQQIEQLRREITQLTQEKQRREQEANTYNRLASHIGIPGYSNKDSFYLNRQKIVEIQEQIRQHQDTLQQERDTLIQEQGQQKRELNELSHELASLLERSNQIPAPDIKLRQQMVTALGLSEDDLPFVGELLRVRASEQRWEPAIERLLHNFGRQLLVAEHYYPTVSHYVNHTDLRGRLVYHRVNPGRTPRHSERLTTGSLYYKLEVKPDTPLSNWLIAELIDGFHYQCCETLEEFQRAHYALTITGQIKHGVGRHEKDDRYPLGDRKRYILGWNNQEKQRALQYECTQRQEALKKAEQKIKSINKEQQKAADMLQVAQALLSIEHFEVMDWQTSHQNIQQKQQILHRLETGSAHLTTLTQQIQATKTLYNEKWKERDKITGLKSRREQERDSYNKQLQSCRRIIDKDILQHKAGIFERIDQDRKELQDREKTLQISLETIDDIRDRMQTFYQNRRNSLTASLRSLESKIINEMRDFRQTSPTLDQEMDASIEAIDEYRRFYENVRHDDLPRHRNRFKDLLNEKVILDISSFKAGLEQQEDDIKARIDQLNTSLATIGYTDMTYIQLNKERSHDTEIRDFRQMLRACIPDTAQDSTPEANERSFQRIRTLLQRFEQDLRWTTKVTDVRNWLDFSASELYRENGEHKNYYSDSSGKSGGQKAKLAYTILASAIAYQYGLDRVEKRERAFRFIAVDEAFSKSDERNARYAMELFRQLDLQVLVVTPLDKIHVAEPYISACHFVKNNEEENSSSVYNLTFQEYLSRKQQWQAKERQTL